MASRPSVRFKDTTKSGGLKMKYNKKFLELPQYMRTKKWIKSEIEYENSPGMHTYHYCDCGRRGCRSVMCSLCWEEALKDDND